MTERFKCTTIMINIDKKESYLEHMNTMFRVHIDASNYVDVELVEVKGRGIVPGYDDKENFTLLFNGSNETAFEQGTYAMTHDSMGSFDLFLQPVVPDRKGMCYEAVFCFAPKPKS